MTSFSIRPIVPDDLGQCRRIASQHWNDWEVRQYMEQIAAGFLGTFPDRPHWIGAIEAGTSHLIGFAGYRRSWQMPNSWELIGVNVDKNRQRRNVGGFLTTMRIRAIQNAGGNYITCATIVPAFFRKFRFKQIDTAAEWTIMARDISLEHTTP
jgi:ribosomal protein S18 acetylase RimI-like enzyme